MKRREFLSATVITGTVLAMDARAGNLVHPEDVGVKLGRSLIWCSQRVPVPVLGSGGASGIADVKSQGGQRNPDFFNDYHANFLKLFTVEGIAADAVLHVFAYTRYRLFVNGTYVGSGPCRFQNERPEFDSWQVREHLRPGNNRIAILAHRDSPTGRIMFHAPGLAALLDFTDRSGRHGLASDETWLSRPDLSFQPRNVAWASIEENIDARLSDDWTAADYPPGTWPAALRVPGDIETFFPRTIPLLRESLRPWNRSFRPVTLEAGDEIELSLDRLGLAYHRLTMTAEDGSELEVHYNLPEGQSSGKARYIARGGSQTWIGGDRFAFDRLGLKVLSGRISITAVEAVEVRYPFDLVGQFSSSDPLLDRIWALCARSLQVLSEDAYIDCADRERVEWTDETPPAFECTRVMMAGPPDARGIVFSDPRLLKILLRRIALTQKPDGQIKAHSCSERWDIHAIMEDRSCDWVIALRQYFDSTGDVQFVRELWPVVSRLLNWFLGRRTARGLVLGREWEVWDNPLRYQTCEGAGLNAFVYHALTDAAYLGRRAGFGAQAVQFQKAADSLAADFNTLLWDDKTGAYSGGLFGEGSQLHDRLDGKMFAGPFDQGRYQPTLQAALFALDAGLVPHERLAPVHAFMLAHLDEARLCMSHHFLFKALYGLNRPDSDQQVLTLMRQKWQAMADSPWGTSWEGLEDWGGSKVHIYGIVPAYFLASYVLGVRLEGNVKDHQLRVEPRPGDLTYAHGVVCTEFGPVPISWQQDVAAFRLNVRVPEGCVAMLRPPPFAGTKARLNGRHVKIQPEYALPAGAHQFIILT